ncbi:hypothetical protein ACHAWO_003762 [Cyclotella atomus]|uniref:RanBP2-type domain-containing protein n=1 Tax=Cyclotella atomus TaxID=382360 RepID=A0ABD3NKI2_9STRA
MMAAPAKSTRNRRAASKHRDAAALSQSMPPSLTQDEEIKALRSHLKKKRSQMPIAAHSLRASALSQRILQNLDIENSFENESSEDEELEELFKRKQSLSLDERIALKKETEMEKSQSLDERIAWKKEKQRHGTSFILTKTEEGSGKKLRRKPSASRSVETEDLSSDDETLPDNASVDSHPHLYTDPSEVLSNFEKKLASVGKAPSQDSLIANQTFHKLTSFEEKIQRKLDQAAAYSKLSKTVSSGPRRRSISAPHPRIDKMKLQVVNQAATAEKDGRTNPSSDEPHDRMQRKHLSYEERLQLKISREAEVSHSANRRRSTSAPRPGVVQVQYPANSPKEKIDKSTVESMSSALDAFEGRLKEKLSQGTSSSSPTKSVPKRVLPARAQSDRAFSHDPKMRMKKSRKDTRLSKSVIVGNCKTWHCSKCTYLNKSSSSNETCQVCLEPKNSIVGRGEDAFRAKTSKATKSASALAHNGNELSRIDEAKVGGNLSRVYQSERTLNSSASRRKNVGAARRGANVSKSVNAGAFAAKWHCEKCTYLNGAASKCCKMCLEPVKVVDLQWKDLGSIIDETISMSLREK